VSIFTGPMYPGAMREHRRILREEAEARNARTPLERTAAYRRKHDRVQLIDEIMDAELPACTEALTRLA
jgi:hypothetical protein